MEVGPLTYFVGDRTGRGLIRIETSHDNPNGAGLHITSAARGKHSEQYIAEIVRRCNVHADLLEALGMALESLNAIEVPQEWDCRAKITAALARAKGGAA